MNAVVQSASAYRLAWHDGEQYRTSEFGYLEARAAQTAAPILNRARVGRQRPIYTHVVAYQGLRVVAVEQLEAA